VAGFILISRMTVLRIAIRNRICHRACIQDVKEQKKGCKAGETGSENLYKSDPTEHERRPANEI
jgi:hypothetical protein